MPEHTNSFINLGGSGLSKDNAEPFKKALPENISTEPELIDTAAPVCECAVFITEDPEAVCTTAATTKKIAQILDIKEETPKEIMEGAAEKLGVEKQSEVVSKLSEHPDIYAELTRFKPTGPATTTRLLSNYNIDAVIDQWAQKWKDFLHIPFQFIDFATTEAHPANRKYMIDNLNDYDPLDDYKTMGCIINTDHTGGPGKHWVCVFVDKRSSPWTIEYFNSSGNPPPYEIIRWEFKTKTQMMSLKKLPGDVEIIRVTSIQHQYSKTECGVYCLYYIFNRLKNRPYTLFSKNIVEDEDMLEFREHLFR